MKKIKLTQDQIALIDDKDFNLINQHKWCAVKARGTHYAVRQITIRSGNKQKNIERKQKMIYMHREIMKNKFEKDEDIDHINGNGLDNRRCNLRSCTRSENLMNQKKTRGSSKYKGVYFYKITKKWRTVIMLDGQQIHLGYFNNEIEAAKAYNKAAIEYFGKFARLNNV